jgi:hypothetical protein
MGGWIKAGGQSCPQLENPLSPSSLEEMATATAVQTTKSIMGSTAAKRP